MATIELSDIEVRGNDAGALLAYLGRNLAALWLEAEQVLKLGLAGRDLLPAVSGSCTAIFVWKKKPSELLAKSFLLPMRWVRDKKDSALLPRKLRLVANNARMALTSGGQDWGLQPGDGFEHDLSALPLEVNSCWAPLAASLLVAAEGGRPDSSVFATGCWSGTGIGAVADIEHKVAAVERMLGLASFDKASLFVPGANYDDAVKALAGDGRVEILYYHPELDVPRKALAGHLRKLEVPPDSKASLAEKLDWANRDYRLADNRVRTDYHLKNLAAELGQKLELPSGVKAGGRLLLPVGFSPGVCLLLLHALRPVEIRLLASKDSEQGARYIKEQAGGLGIGCPEPFMVDDFGRLDRQADKFAYWLKGAPGRAWADVTGGTKEMSLVVVEAARRSGAEVIYLRHKNHPAHNQPLYGHESLVVCDWLGK